MLSGAHRFHGHNSLNAVYRYGRMVRGPLLALRFMERGPNANYRCAVVVSRKVHKSAVVRNRIRRRIYHLVRDLSADLKPGYDLAFMANSDQLAKLPPKELQTNVQKLLSDAKLLAVTPAPTPTKPANHGMIQEKGK
jgi:ribonuclease P protein component